MDSSAFIPELVSLDYKAAEAALKTLLFYFPHVRLASAALLFEHAIMEFGPDGKPTGNMVAMNHHALSEIRELDATWRLLGAEGVLTETQRPTVDNVSVFPSAAVEDWQEYLSHDLQTVLRTCRIEPGTRDWSIAHHRHTVSLVSALGLTANAKGLPTVTEPTVGFLFQERARESMSKAWETVPVPTRQRVARDFLAYGIVRNQLRDLSSLSYEQVLELRRKQADNLLRFRSAVAKLSADVNLVPGTSDFETFVSKTIEEHVQPALVELDRELEHLGRTSALKSLPAPSLLGTVGLIANLAGKVSPEQLALLAATSAAGSMAYRFYEHHVQKKQLIAQSPFSVILDVRKVTRRS